MCVMNADECGFSEAAAVRHVCHPHGPESCLAALCVAIARVAERKVDDLICRIGLNPPGPGIPLDRGIPCWMVTMAAVRGWAERWPPLWRRQGKGGKGGARRKGRGCETLSPACPAPPRSGVIPASPRPEERQPTLPNRGGLCYMLKARQRRLGMVCSFHRPDSGPQTVPPQVKGQGKRPQKGTADSRLGSQARRTKTVGSYFHKRLHHPSCPTAA